MKYLDRWKKNMSPTRLIALSFFLVILIGAILLSLPICNKADSIPFIDHLFIATSATCVTGLVSVCVAQQYNVIGQLVIILLIQIGGLGFLTLLNVFYVFLHKKLSLKNKIIMQEALNQESLKDIHIYIKRVFLYTFVIEMIGALCLMFVFVPEFGLKGIYYSIFHSISAFCNAGFDILGSQSLIPYYNHFWLNIVISSLILLGGIGFVVMIELIHSYHNYKLKFKTFHIKKYIKNLSVHTKIVLLMTFILVFLGMIVILLLEYNHTLSSMPFNEKLLVSYFQSVTLRTAGFASVDMSALTPATKYFMSFIMFIGGSPAGTAGGIKTVTFVMMILHIVSLIKGAEHVHIFDKTIDDHIIKKSLSIIIISITICFISLFLLTISENVSLIDLVFEVFSAFATVGLSAGISPILSVFGKIVVILLMYIGRIGPITMLLIFAKQYNSKKGKDINFAKENVLIG